MAAAPNLMPLLLFLVALSLQNIGRGHADMNRLLGHRSIPLSGHTEPV